jgi:hypothetical protein
VTLRRSLAVQNAVRGPIGRVQQARHLSVDRARGFEVPEGDVRRQRGLRQGAATHPRAAGAQRLSSTRLPEARRAGRQGVAVLRGCKHLARPFETTVAVAGTSNGCLARARVAQITWAALLRKKLPAPWVPRVQGPFDTTFFDEQYGDSDEGGGGGKTDNRGQTYEDLAAKLPADWDKDFDSCRRPKSGTSAAAGTAGGVQSSISAAIATAQVCHESSCSRQWQTARASAPRVSRRVRRSIPFVSRCDALC